MSDRLLELQGVCRAFGGLKVISDLNYSIGEKEVRVIIGPNGAGKSTTLKLISGFLAPDSGTISIFGKAINGTPAYQRHRLGLAQTFQTPRVIHDLTIEENLQLAINPPGIMLAAMISWGLPNDCRTKIAGAMERTGLERDSRTLVRNLTHAELKRLDIAMAVIRSPRLLMLDEPTAGLGVEESFRIAKLIHDLSESMAIIVVEHDMNFVQQLNERITVLHNGAIFREGSFSELAGDPDVRRIYLGEHDGDCI